MPQKVRKIKRYVWNFFFFEICHMLRIFWHLQTKRNCLNNAKLWQRYFFYVGIDAFCSYEFRYILVCVRITRSCFILKILYYICLFFIFTWLKIQKYKYLSSFKNILPLFYCKFIFNYHLPCSEPTETSSPVRQWPLKISQGRSSKQGFK